MLHLNTRRSVETECNAEYDTRFQFSMSFQIKFSAWKITEETGHGASN